MKKGKRKQQKQADDALKEKDLDRFAGSSDEDDNDNDDKQIEDNDIDKNGCDDHTSNENDNDEGDSEDGEGLPSKDGFLKEEKNESSDDSSTSSIDERLTVDPAAKMANAMGRILRTQSSQSKKEKAETKSPSTSSVVVLGKTITTLQKLQLEEKQKLKLMKEKRQTSKERNLSALHYPLSIATNNKTASSTLSVSKELEQERVHRRVATRGVVALFNAISQHQKSTSTTSEMDSTLSGTKRKDNISKMTKHTFLDKIKSVAKSKIVADGNDTIKASTTTIETKQEKPSKPSWNALQDDYMLNPKKNWDEESSSEEEEDPTSIPDPYLENSDDDDMAKSKPQKKQRMAMEQ